MSKKERESGRKGSLEGILQSFADLLEKLGEVADKGEQLSRTGEIHSKDGKKGFKGVYGFSIKVGLGDEGVKVEPFGNIRKDKESGQPIVQEIIEPVVDIFEEGDHTLIVAEMPGIGAEDVRLDIKDDVLTIYAERKNKKYQKEVLLSTSYPKEKMIVSCNNGILEIKCIR